MSKYIVKTVWFWRKHEDGPELLEAWDEYSVDQNEDGWLNAVHVAWEQVKKDDAGNGIRFIDIVIDFDVVERSFYPVEIEGNAGLSDGQNSDD